MTERQPRVFVRKLERPRNCSEDIKVLKVRWSDVEKKQLVGLGGS